VVYAAIDIHEHVFEAAVLDPGTGETKFRARHSCSIAYAT
jgi:hypothetical protein